MASSTLNVKLPEGLEREVDEFLREHPRYMNKSEFVRDAIRHLMEETPVTLSEETLEVIERGKDQVESEEGRTLDEVRSRTDG